MEELKPCPFCGNENVIHHTHSRQARRVAKQEGASLPDMIVCYQCGAACSFMGSEINATKAWNRRADEF